MNKDQSIITQVAAKIAADLTPPHDDVNTRIASWLDAFDAVREALFNAHGDSIATAQNVAPTTTTSATPMQEQAMIQQAFPTAAPASFEVRVKGKQHGPLPEWLITACQRDGVSEVWDNRDSIAANPKRPWFKATSGDKAYWQPRN